MLTKRMLFKSSIILAMCFMFVSNGFCDSSENRGYLRFPSISEESVLFTAEGDLWTVSDQGGIARRLTHDNGREAFARYSPDGKWIAFSGEYDGNEDVFIIPSNGGEPKRLTYHPGSDQVVAWKPDSSSIIFRSRRFSPHGDWHVYTIDRTGGFPEKMKIGKASLISFSSEGSSFAFNRFSREFRNWKNYRGGWQQDIWFGDLQSNEFRKLTDFQGTDAFPMIHESRIYFLSDREGTVNIYSMDFAGKDLKKHTSSDYYDVQWPSMSHSRIIYQLGADLYILDLNASTDRKLDIQVPSDKIQSRTTPINPVNYITSFGLSPQGKRLLLTSRGDVYAIPVKQGRIISVTDTQGVREKFPTYSPDGTQIALFSDVTGEEELMIYSSHGMGKEKAKFLTSESKSWHFGPLWSPDSEHIAFADMTMSLFVINCKSGLRLKVDESSRDEITEYSWSPDGKWLVYSKVEDNTFSSIYLFSLEQKKSFVLTDSFTNDYSPCFDPEGKYLYFLSDRTLNPLIGSLDFETIFDKMAKPYCIILDKAGKSPFFPKEPEETEDEKAPWEKFKEKDGKELPVVKIDIQGISERIDEFPVDEGHYSKILGIKGKVFYLKRKSMGLRDQRKLWDSKSSIYTLHKFDLEKKEEEVFVEGIDDYSVSANFEKVVYRRKKDFTVMEVEQRSWQGMEQEIVKLDQWSMQINPVKEWYQIFYEAWRLQRDFYWAPNMAGIDWDAMKSKYEKLLPHISSRDDLNDLIGEMIAELSTSHTYIWGGDTVKSKKIPVGLLGAELEPDEKSGLYKFVKVYQGDSWNKEHRGPLTLSHGQVKPGDYLLAINGKEVKTSLNFYEFLINKENEKILLTVNSTPTEKEARNIEIVTINREHGLVYSDWVHNNINYVTKKTENQIGYLHIPNMDYAGLVAFSKHFYPQLEKKGLIIDVRNNGGGFVSQLILERLYRKLIAFDKPRRGLSYNYPYRSFHGHIVVLCDQKSGSDGDIFTEAFKMFNLGTVIGMRTWGGVVGIRMDKPFVDGGVMSEPEYAWWDSISGWDLENRGSIPDIELDNTPSDAVKGVDAQLEKAIEVILDSLEKEPRTIPDPPPYPDKSRK